MSIYRVDVDETLCEYYLDRNYEDAVPIVENIEKVNKLYEAGHTIIIWTSRGVGSGINCWYITQRQLVKWGVKFHELRCDKPEFDYIIDDKTVKIEDL